MKSSRVKVWAELLAHYCGDIGWGDREISVTSEIFFQKITLVTETVVTN